MSEYPLLSQDGANVVDVDTPAAPPNAASVPLSFRYLLLPIIG